MKLYETHDNCMHACFCPLGAPRSERFTKQAWQSKISFLPPFTPYLLLASLPLKKTNLHLSIRNNRAFEGDLRAPHRR